MFTNFMGKNIHWKDSINGSAEQGFSTGFRKMTSLAPPAVDTVDKTVITDVHLYLKLMS